MQTSARMCIARVSVSGPFLHCASANNHWATIVSLLAALGISAPGLRKTDRLAQAFDPSGFIVLLTPGHRRQQFPVQRRVAAPLWTFFLEDLRRRERDCITRSNAFSWKTACLVDFYPTKIGQRRPMTMPRYAPISLQHKMTGRKALPASFRPVSAGISKPMDLLGCGKVYNTVNGCSNLAQTLLRWILRYNNGKQTFPYVP